MLEKHCGMGVTVGRSRSLPVRELRFWMTKAAAEAKYWSKPIEKRYCENPAKVNGLFGGVQPSHPSRVHAPSSQTGMRTRDFANKRAHAERNGTSCVKWPRCSAHGRQPSRHDDILALSLQRVSLQPTVCGWR